MNLNTLDMVFGWSTGYGYALEKNGEDEIKQGKNYYISAFSKVGQIGQFGIMLIKISMLSSSTPLQGFVRNFAQLAPIGSLPLHLFFASVKQGDYESFSKKVNEMCDRMGGFIRLPEKLEQRSIRVVNFLVERLGDLINVAMVVTSVVLVVFGNPYFGTGVLLALSYNAIDRRGLVPRKMSLFIETYMPIISPLGVIIGGTTTMKIYSAFSLLNYLFCSNNRLVHHRIDSFFHLLFKNIPMFYIPTLRDIDAPVVEEKELTFQKINEILDGDDSSYKINPAHCSKPIDGLLEFSVNHDFDLYLKLFDKIDWAKKYVLLEKSLKNDEAFMDSFKEEFLGVEKEELSKNFNVYMDQIALKEGISKEEYAAKCLRKQFCTLISILKGEGRAKGAQKDLADAINDCSKILPYLESIQEDSPIEFEDILLKLAVEGGDYCARGIKRAAAELMNNILSSGLRDQESNPSSMKNYELDIARKLQDQRSSLIQKAYQRISNFYPQTISKDIHFFDIYRTGLSLGFFPLTEHERNSFNILSLFLWEFSGLLRSNMYQEYLENLDQAVESDSNFTNYIRQVIMENSKLSDEQKDLILEKYTEANHGKWTVKETNKRFHRLMFVMLGVLSEKT